MPKRVDHEARRQQIADALLRLTASRGLEAVSLRHVAREAGLSMGAVQHYFKTKDEMLVFALQHQAEQRDRRITARVTGADLSPKSVLRICVLEMLPTDEQSRLEWLVGVAYFIRTVAEPSLAAYTDGIPKALEFFAGQLRRAQDEGDVAADADPDSEAAVLWALADSLGVTITLGHQTPAEAVSIVDYHLDRLFSGGS
ncbi:TetR/AcrR family transcriptional regulator [Amycolatopsis anabasis]|uniref:TetR/AcrR family transcriptional regulator n=1 Tax=Amycolatopsis anabasis TaxID=1840409 RepID=UPI0015D22FC5|nr:TetR/AcrR family transcriptional regulator [Amycolatopsis anabasis]